MTADKKPFAFPPALHQERSGAFSPDGRSIAYWSEASGRSEVYVRGFPSGEEEVKVSRDGGMAPRWSWDGKELFFLSLNATLMVARIDTANRMKAASPQSLFPTDLQLANGNPYVVAKDGQRFLMPVPIDSPDSSSIRVVTNWTAKVPK